MPTLPSFLQRRPKELLPPPPVTIYYLSSPPPHIPLRPIPPPSSPRALPPQTLLFSLTHPHPSTSTPTSFFLSCIPDPIGFLYHSASFISKHLSLSGANGIPSEWRHQLIQLELEEKDGLAATSGGKIGVSLRWVEQVMRGVEKGERSLDGAVKEFKGVLLHELVHTIQHDGSGTTPGWLIESIADYVRLLASLDPPHWRKSGSGRKDKGWEDGYDVGARFLEWLVGVETPRSLGAAAIPNQSSHDNFEKGGQHPEAVVSSSSMTTPTTTTGSAAPETRPTQITHGMLHPDPPSYDFGNQPASEGTEKGRERPGPFPDLVRLMDARLKYERWEDAWWREMTGFTLKQLWTVYVEYYR